MITDDPVAIGRYKVLSRLGAGAMGAVYLCQDPLLKRRVAVKIVLRTRADSEAMMARFQRESEISAQLNHPHIITVFDVGNDEAVGPFLTMEFVDGGSLAGRLEQGAPDAATALDWLAQLGQALAAAERAGVVHRDIKPENMLVSREGQLKLTDFGLARDDVGSLTTTGTLMGTPTHTAPELLGGARATPITDRWAFAVTAFQMVTGGLPHSGETLSALLHHIDQEPPSIPEGTPAPLARVFLKALHRDPARRYPSILAFLQALAEALGLPDKLSTRGLATEAPPPEATASRASTPRLAASGETEVFALPRAARASGAASGAIAPAASARLTRPPADLFRDAEESPAPDPGEALIQRTSAARTAPMRSSGSRPPARGAWSPPSSLPGNALVVLVVGLAVAGFFLWPRPLSIQTTPPGAEVSLDGQVVGYSPFEGTVRFGSHRLVVSKAGFDPVATLIRTSEGPVVLALQPATAWVDLQTVPPGAAAVLGDRALGSTPRKGVLVPDRAAPLVITLAGYKRWEGVLGPGRRPPTPIVLVPEHR